MNGQPLTEATVGDDLHATETESPTQTIKVGKQQMNGSTLLNYARFRDDDEGDYGRTKRQQQVMSAVLEQIKDPTKLFTGSEALGKVFGMTSTNLPYSFLLTNGLSVLEGAQNGIERLALPLIIWPIAVIRALSGAIPKICRRVEMISIMVPPINRYMRALL